MGEVEITRTRVVAEQRSGRKWGLARLLMQHGGGCAGEERGITFAAYVCVDDLNPDALVLLRSDGHSERQGEFIPTLLLPCCCHPPRHLPRAMNGHQQSGPQGSPTV
jgi:hypothetical protein